MKAAVFRTVHQPLTIEDVDISAPGPARGLRADGGGGRLPQRRALPAGSLPLSDPHRARPRIRWYRRSRRLRGALRAAWGPRYYLSIRLLWPLQLLYDRPPSSL